MNIFDRLIESVSPRRAAERAYWRSVMASVRGYEAAKTGRRTDGWVTSGSSANAEIGPAAARIRARSRDLVRNNPWASNAVRKLASKVVGTGIVPRLAAGTDKQLKGRVRDEWNAFVENADPAGQLDFYGLHRLAVRTMYESGEVLIRFLPRPSSWNLRVPLQVAVLEPDYLDAGKTEGLANGGAIIQGVEFDQFGRRVAYWLFDQHPGESWPSIGRAKGLISQRVPASEVLHVFEPLRPGQARGVSVFTPVVMKLRDADDLDDAEVMRRKIASCFVAFVKKGGMDAGTLAGAPTSKVTTTDGAGRRLEAMNPGRIQYLESDQDVTFGSPPAAEGYLDTMRYQLLAIAAGTGTTYEQLTGDLSNVNFISGRLGLIDFADIVEQQQWLVQVPQLSRPTFRRVLAVQQARGILQAGPLADVYTPPRKKLLDPKADITASREAQRAGLLTPRDAVAEFGYDPDEHFAEIAETWKQWDDLGLIFDTDPRKVSRAGTPAKTGEETSGDGASSNANGPAEEPAPAD